MRQIDVKAKILFGGSMVKKRKLDDCKEVPCPPMPLTLINRSIKAAALFEVVVPIKPFQKFVCADSPRLSQPQDADRRNSMRDDEQGESCLPDQSIPAYMPSMASALKRLMGEVSRNSVRDDAQEKTSLQDQSVSTHTPTMASAFKRLMGEVRCNSVRDDAQWENSLQNQSSNVEPTRDIGAERDLGQESGLKYDASMGDMLRKLISPRPIITTSGGRSDNVGFNSPILDPLLNSEGGLEYLLSLDGDDFIRAAYLKVLNRAVDPTGLNYYRQRLFIGISRREILGQLAHSSEGRSTGEWRSRLRHSYSVLRRRSVTPFRWATEIISAFKKYHLHEITRRDGDQFIMEAFRAVLGRSPDKAGFEHYRIQLLSGRDKVSILADMRMSKESKAVGNRVAGLTAIAWLRKFRRTILVKQLVDILNLPWVAADILKNLRGLALEVRELRSQHESRFDTVLESLRADRAQALALSEQALTRYQDMSDLLWQQKAALTSEMVTFADDIKSMLIAAQAAGQDNLKHAIRQADLSFEKSVGVIKGDISRRLETAQAQLRAQGDQYVKDVTALVTREHAAAGVEARQLQQKVDRLSAALPKAIDDAKVSVLKALKKSTAADDAARQLQQKVDRLSAVLPKAIDDTKVSVLNALKKSTAADDAARQLQQTVDRLSAVLPKAIDDTKVSVLNALKKSTAADDAARQLQQTVDRLSAALPKAIDDAKVSVLNALEESTAADDAARQLQQTVDRLGAVLPKAIDDAKVSVLNALEESTAADDAARQLQQTVDRLGAVLPKAIDDAKVSVLNALEESTAADDAARQLQQTVDRLSAVLPKAIDDAKVSVLNALEESEAADDAVRQLQQIVDRLSLALPKTIEDAKTSVLDALEKDAVSQNLLREQVSRDFASAGELLGHKTAMLGDETRKFANELQAQLREMNGNITHAVRETSSHLEQTFPQSIELARGAISSQIAENQAIQQQLRAELQQFSPQFDRIELYSLKSARRVAVPCGENDILVRTNIGYVLCASDDHALVATLVEAGELEPGIRMLIQRLLSPGDVFLDVGANVGMHSIAAAQTMRGQGRIIAFEPYSPTAKLLEKTVWINGFQNIVDVKNEAVFDVQGERALHLGATSGHHSLFPHEGHLPITDTAVNVPVTTLDHAVANLPSANLIKIDVEGAESAVMAGAGALLGRSKDIGIIAEFGISHLRRVGVGVHDWLASFHRHGFVHRAIHAESGAIYEISIDELEAADSVNLFFARPLSPILEKAEYKK
ncbi:FkbM family methyltransferase [Burkholderia lata]|nr:FkbM family methyltransferase [Burkholderia lata]